MLRFSGSSDGVSNVANPSGFGSSRRRRPPLVARPVNPNPEPADPQILTWIRQPHDLVILVHCKDLEEAEVMQRAFLDYLKNLRG